MRALVGLIIAVFGTPALSGLLSPLAATVGFGLMWWQFAEFSSKWRRFWAGFGCFALVHGTAISWMATPFYHGAYIIFLYAILVALFSAQFGLLCMWFSRKRLMHLPSAIAGCCGWVICEWSRHYILCGYSWNPLGLSLSYSHIPMQLAAVVGMYGLSLVVVLTNVAFARWQLGNRGARLPFIAMAIIPYIYGGVVVLCHDRGMLEGEVWKVALVQTGLEIEEKYHLSGMEGHMIHPTLQWKDVVLRLGQCRPGDLDLIVMPESAFPMYAHTQLHHSDDVHYLFNAAFEGNRWRPEGHVSNFEIARALAETLGSDVIFGTDHMEGEKSYSTEMLITPEGDSAFYGKRILFPLAEALPFEALRPVAEKYGVFGFFSPGEQPKILQGKGRWVASICYEELFGDFTRFRHADMIVNVTNDGWYHHTMLPKQHYVHGRVRAVENGVPLVRACNTGVTAAVDSLGREIASLPVEKKNGRWVRDILHARVPKYRIDTIYSRFGDFPVLILCFLAILHLALRKSCSKN